MKEISATEAARHLSQVLDAVEHLGESFTVTRNGRPVAKIGPAKIHTGGDLLDFLRENPPDPEWERDIAWIRELPAQERTRPE